MGQSWTGMNFLYSLHSAQWCLMLRKRQPIGSSAMASSAIDATTAQAVRSSTTFGNSTPSPPASRTLSVQNRPVWVLRLTWAAILIAVIYGGFFGGLEVMTSINIKDKDDPHPPDAIKTSPYPKRLPLNLPILKCHSNEPSYHACMLETGHAINPTWIVTHDSDAKNSSQNAIEVVRDPFRADVSPVYGIPHLAPKQDKNVRS